MVSSITSQEAIPSIHTLQATLSVNLTQATPAERRKWMVKETERNKTAGALEEKEEKGERQRRKT